MARDDRLRRRLWARRLRLNRTESGTVACHVSVVPLPADVEASDLVAPFPDHYGPTLWFGHEWPGFAEGDRTAYGSTPQ